MKFSRNILPCRRDEFHESLTSRRFETGENLGTRGIRPSERAFTMIEIALCLAIVSFALLVIIGVLPRGMHTQRQTREETIISQDASMLLEAIRNGSRGLDDLTNNIYLITNYWAFYDNKGNSKPGKNGYTWDGSTIPNNWPGGSAFMPITNGLRIIGLLSTPEYMDANSQPINNLANGGYSNHIYAYVRSFSGLAAEKPPQNNQIMREDTFSYRILCVNAPMAVDANSVSNHSSVFSAYDYQLAGNLRELRLLFLWPQLPNGNVGDFRQSFRASIGGQLITTNDYVFTNQPLYFYQSQSFTKAP